MVFRIFPKARYDQALGIGLSGAAVSHEEEIRLAAADKLCRTRQTLSICPCAAVVCELFCRGAAKALVEW